MEARGLTVAVTGPTGGIGLPFVRALDRDPAVDRVIGMARRPFDPHVMGLEKLEYRRGDILDRTSLDDLVKGCDVVVHLAFMIFGSAEETKEINLDGSRNVFEAAFAAGVSRLVYTSSVAAYGFSDDNPDVLTEDVAALGKDGHYYSQHKAELERLLDHLARNSATDVYVFRPCVVAGPHALELVENIPLLKLGEKIPPAIRKLAGTIPRLRPVIPDPGFPFQLVHEDDVAAALVAAVHGRGEPGAYNLAAEGEISLGDVAHALGWYSVPVPEIALDTTVKIVSRLPLVPTIADWINVLKVPVLMDCTKARTLLGWEPKHDALETLSQTIHAARARGILGLGLGRGTGAG